MDREKLELDVEEARDIIYNDHEGYDVISDVISSTGRWSAHHDVVIKRVSDGKYFADTYSEGLTESQDESPYDYGEPNFIEVFPVEKTIIVYE